MTKTGRLFPGLLVFAAAVSCGDDGGAFGEVSLGGHAPDPEADPFPGPGDHLHVGPEPLLAVHGDQRLEHVALGLLHHAGNDIFWYVYVFFCHNSFLL